MWLIGSFVQLVQLISFDCLLQLVSFDCSISCFSLCYVFVAYHSFAIFGPQYSLSSSKYLPLDMCIAFHALVEKYTIYGGPKFILAFLDFRPFQQSMPMGEKFQRVLWRRFSVSCPCFGFVPKHLHLILLHHWLLHCMVMHNSLHKLS